MKKELKNILPIEILIVDSRVSSESISEMSDADLRVMADKVILECSTTTGCELPFTDFFAEGLSRSMISFLKEFGYDDLSLEEIILALKLNMRHRLKMPSGIEMEEVAFSGRCVNVGFISKVLWNYMQIRNLLDRKFQNHIDGY